MVGDRKLSSDYYRALGAFAEGDTGRFQQGGGEVFGGLTKRVHAVPNQHLVHVLRAALQFGMRDPDNT
jgi:hypothetical protein